MIQPIDFWKLNRKLELVIEAKVGKGKLLICEIGILNNLDERPVANQFRKSLINYLPPTVFNPQTEVKLTVISSLFNQSNLEVKADFPREPTEKNKPF